MNKILCALLFFVVVIFFGINYSPYKIYSNDSNQSINEGFTSRKEQSDIAAYVFLGLFLLFTIPFLIFGLMAIAYK